MRQSDFPGDKSIHLNSYANSKGLYQQTGQGLYVFIHVWTWNQSESSLCLLTNWTQTGCNRHKLDSDWFQQAQTWLGLVPMITVCRYYSYLVIRQDFALLKLQQIWKSVLWKSAIKWVLLFQTYSQRSEGPAYKMDLDRWNNFGKENPSLITKEIQIIKHSLCMLWLQSCFRIVNIIFLYRTFLRDFHLFLFSITDFSFLWK